MRQKKCNHLDVSFLGFQETGVTGKKLALYNCSSCKTTISIPVLNIHDNGSTQRRAVEASYK